MNRAVRCAILLLAWAGGTACLCERAQAADSAAVKVLLSQPPREYSTAPLWVWNDLLTEDQVRGTLRDLAGQKVMQAFVHPRPGLMTPYLSPEWFRLWKIALDEAEKLDMNIWIYDENSYPSGFAGGLVPEAMPEARGRGLHLVEVSKVERPGEDVLAVFRITDTGYENITSKARAGEALPKGRYLAAQQRLAPPGGWFGGKSYVDLLHPGVTEKFIQITHEAYRREIGSQFGKRMPGVFNDEPHLAPAGGLHWSENMPQEFQKRWGYSLVDNLPALVRPIGDWKRVRHDYQQFLLEQFIEHWSRPIHDFCEKYGIEFTGHYWEHGWPDASHGPDNMAMYAWQQRPGIDILRNQYQEDVHAQFGNARSVKELSSVANQLGKKRTLCEVYGAGGWDLRFEDMKRIGDWIGVLGVNTFDQHLSDITLRGARKADYPQSFSYHEPWWEAYHVLAEYFSRMSLVMSSGEQINEVLLLEPTTTAWMYQNDPTHAKHLQRLGDEFQDIVNLLERQQVEYDIGCEDIIARHGSVGEKDSGPCLKVGRRSYSIVVLPPFVENLNGKTMDLLENYLKKGGIVYCYGQPPALVDGRPSERGQALARSRGWSKISECPSINSRNFSIRRKDEGKGILFHHRRHLEDGEIVLLVNTSIDSPSAGSIQSSARGVEKWDPQTGAVSLYPNTPTSNGIETTFELPPCGSLLLFLSQKPLTETAAVGASKTTKMVPAGGTNSRRIEPNVLTLDYVDITAGGETRKGIYYYLGNRMAFQKNGMEGNPWDSAVQFRDELITRKFPPQSGFEASYRFTIRDQVPKSLAIVIERPDLYQITCNGQSISWDASRPWWLDRAFGRLDIASAAHMGENIVTIKAQPFTIFHELEPAYLLGDFSLKATDKGFEVISQIPLKLGPWNQQGYPMYAAGVAYTQTFNVPQNSGRFFVRLPKWYGSVAKVVVNGKPAGYIGYPPWQCEVTEQLKADANTIEVNVIGTLKNTLGPHHVGPILGSASPGEFRRGPANGPPAGEQYHTVGYGLMEPFVLERSDR